MEKFFVQCAGDRANHRLFLMLSRLFTSKARIKLLTIFLLNPTEEYFVRELTRKLGEQINAVRRELENLKKLGLLKSRNRNRRKFYTVNNQFVLFRDLRNLFLKAVNSHDHLVKKLQEIGDLDFILLSGIFFNKNEAEVDLLLVGNVDKDALTSFLSRELDFEREIKFTLLTKDDFAYRLKYNDRFLSQLLADEENLIAWNRLENL